MNLMDTRRPRASLGLADRFWLLVHDCLSWKPQLAEPAMGFGLAAALLGEQIFVGNCSIVNDEIRWYRTPRLTDSLVQSVAHQLYWAQVEADAPIKIATALDLLRRNAYVDVAERLHRYGIARRDHSRRIFRTAVRYPVVDPNAGMSLRAHLDNALFSDSEPQIGDHFVAVLVWATYLTRDVFPDVLDSAAALARYRTKLPPVHRLIVEFTRSGIDEAVASRGGH